MELNYAKGWRSSDLTFLRELSDLEAIDITDWNIDDVSAVNKLSRLRDLSISTYCKTILDFFNWPNLEQCSLEWRPGAASLFEHRGVKTIFINKFRGRDLSDFSGMIQLETLRLKGPTRLESCRGIESLTRLTHFELALATKLNSLEHLESLTRVQHLVIHTCRKVGNISPLQALREIRELHLNNCGDIKSIQVLRNLKNLEKFLFYESTNVLDGDLSVLEKLPRLKVVAFKERPHYSHKRADLATE